MLPKQAPYHLATSRKEYILEFCRGKPGEKRTRAKSAGRRAVYCTDAPNGMSASRAILKHCLPNGMPIMVMHHRQPRTR